MPPYSPWTPDRAWTGLTVLLAIICGVASASLPHNPASLGERQVTSLCYPAPPFNSNTLHGGKVNIASSLNNSLFFNASFPDPTFNTTFNQTLLAEKIHDQDWSVSEWYVIQDGEDKWKISTGVGPDAAWCLSTNGTGVACTKAISFEIQCTDCELPRYCSLRQVDELGPCLAWNETVNAPLEGGVPVLGPYLCNNIVDFVLAQRAPQANQTLDASTNITMWTEFAEELREAM